MSAVIPPYKDEDLEGETVNKKDLVSYLQDNASVQFLVDHKLKGAAKNVIKTKTREQLVHDYKELISTKAFKCESDPVDKGANGDKSAADEKVESDKAAVDSLADKTKKLDVKDKPQEAPKYTKRILKMGDRSRNPVKGDDVAVFYTGKLLNGKVFDTNMDADKKGKKRPPLRFKVGLGKVIRGWDEALMTMTPGERAEIIIQPEWAYGKKGIEGKIPPSAVLTFEVELINIE